MQGRRKLLKILGVSGATGAVWKKPVVDAISLPAHAQTSCSDCVLVNDANSARFELFDGSSEVGFILVFDNQNCDGEGFPDLAAVIASDAAEAATIWNNSEDIGNKCEDSLVRVENIDGGQGFASCSLWTCNSLN